MGDGEGEGIGGEGERGRGSYVPSGAIVWLMGKGLDGTRVSVSVSVLVLWKVGIGSGSGIGGGCGREGVGAWFVGVVFGWIGLGWFWCCVGFC